MVISKILTRLGIYWGILSSFKVVTSSDRSSRPRTKRSGNREWVTVIQGVCATGRAVPSYVVVKGIYHLLSWHQNCQFLKNWRNHTSENGWTTNEIDLDWMKHFDQFIKAPTKGIYRLLAMDGHESRHSFNFKDYCWKNNIVTLCMPPHSFHFLQLLDVRCFGPLKVSYGKQIK